MPIAARRSLGAKRSLAIKPDVLAEDGGSGCVLYLPMQEGSGTTVYDKSGNGNDGSINGACLPADTLIKTTEGVKPISEVNNNDLVYSYSKNGIVSQRVKSLISSGRKKIYELKTSNRTIRASAKHPFLIPVLNKRHRVKGYNQAKTHPFSYIENNWSLKWIPLEKIKEGYGIVTFSSLNLEKETKYPLEFMQIIGAFLGDGSFHKRNRGSCDEYSLALHVHNFQLAKKYKEKLERLGVSSHIDEKGSLHFYTKEVGRRFEELELGHNVYEKYVPTWVWKLSKTEKESLIQGLINTDGWRLKAGGYGIELSNEQLLQEIRELCLDCGYRVSNTQYRKRKGHIIEKERWLPETESWTFYFYPNSKKNNSEIRVDDGSGVKRRVNSLELPLGFELQTVHSIQPLETEEVFDLEIPMYHNFIADDIVVHNSWTEKGHTGRALSFDGSGDYVDMGDVLIDGWSKMTAMAWIYPRSLVSSSSPDGHSPGEDYVLHKCGAADDNFGITVSTGGVGYYHDDGGDHSIVGSTPPTNEWTHICCVLDSSMHIYLNGELDTEGQSVGTLISNSNTLQVGGRPQIDEYFDGLIDSVRIYNRALSADEIKAIYYGSRVPIKRSISVKR